MISLTLTKDDAIKMLEIIMRYEISMGAIDYSLNDIERKLMDYIRKENE